MAHAAAQRIAEYVHETVGDGLRTVVTITEDGLEIAYLRDDLQQQYRDDSYATVVEFFRLDQPFSSPDLEGNPIGERRAIVHHHENAFVIQLPVSETETILISLGCDAGRDLLSFIESCRQIVADPPEG